MADYKREFSWKTNSYENMRLSDRLGAEDEKQKKLPFGSFFCGRNRTRTCDLSDVNRMF